MCPLSAVRSTDVASETRRIVPQVEGNVEHRAARNPQELALGVWRKLEVQPAHRACLLGHAGILLHEADRRDAACEFALAKNLRQDAARVANARRDHDHGARDCKRQDIHGGAVIACFGRLRPKALSR
jgi:hypothetical protein